MSSGTKIPLALAQEKAGIFREFIRGCVLCCKIAGSIRRRKERVGDIELVVIPVFTIEEDLFGGVASKENLLWSKLDRFEKNGIIEYVKKGDKYRQIIFENIKVDIFTADEDSWGWIFLIRTGSADFSKRIATALNHNGFTSRNGHIIRMDATERVISTPTEQDVFNLIGIPFVEPKDRIR